MPDVVVALPAAVAAAAETWIALLPRCRCS